MATLPTAAAARQLGLSRTTLSKLLEQGQLRATPAGLSDTAALVRVRSPVGFVANFAQMVLEGKLPPLGRGL